MPGMHPMGIPSSLPSTNMSSTPSVSSSSSESPAPIQEKPSPQEMQQNYLASLAGKHSAAFPFGYPPNAGNMPGKLFIVS